MIVSDARVSNRRLSFRLQSGIFACVIGPDLVGSPLVLGDRSPIFKD